MTERDELLRLADRLESYSTSEVFPWRNSDMKDAATAFRAASVKGDPVAWRYELADGREWSNGKPGAYIGWHWRLSESKPCVPEGSIRNLTPLYAAPPASDVLREAMRQAQAAIEQAIDCIRGETPEDHSIDASYDTLTKLRDADHCLATALGGFDECAASGKCCIYAGSGPNGEFQCIYCGKPNVQPSDAPPDWKQDQAETTRIKPRSSDPAPAEVTADELAEWCKRNRIFPSWDKARALLDQFEIRRK